jgi:hypothetical protein
VIGRRLEVDARMLAASLAALVAGLAVLGMSRGPAEVEVVIAAAPLPAGVALGGLPLEVTRVRDPSGALLASEVDAVADRTLAAPLGAGDLILESLLVGPTSDRRHAIGLTLRPEQAVHGDLVAGDTVAVYAVRDELPPMRLAAAVPVLSASSGGSFGSGDVAVLLSVDDRLAADLVRAVHRSSLYLVRVGR